MTATLTPYPAHGPRKLKVATVSLAGCFGCHMSFLDIDERLLELIEHVEFDRSPLTDIKTVGHCDIGLIEGGLCNAENVQVLREFRAHCKTLVAVGACAINGGLPAQRNHLDPRRELLTDRVPRSGVPERPRAAAAAQPRAPDPRGGARRLLPARLPALGRRVLELPHRPDGRPHAAPRAMA